MGAFKRAGEKVKQALGIKAASDKEWKPTSNARNTAMVKEVKKFAVQLRRVHADVSIWSKAVEGGLATIKEVLAIPLPKAYHETVMGVEPVDPTEHIVGQSVTSDLLPQTSGVMKAKLQDEVLHPIEMWLSAYKTTKERNKKVELLRLDLDTHRRATAEAQERFHKVDSKLQAKGASSALGGAGTSGVEAVAGDPSDRNKHETVRHKMLNEVDKTNRLAQRYAENEAEVFNALVTLIADTFHLREYIAGALLIMQVTFATSYGAFDLRSTLRMPLLPEAAVVSHDIHSPASQGSLGARPPAPPYMTQSLARFPPTSSSMGGNMGNGGYDHDRHVGGTSFGRLPVSTSMVAGSSDNPFGGPSTSLAPSPKNTGGVGRVPAIAEGGDNPFGPSSGGVGSSSPQHGAPNSNGTFRRATAPPESSLPSAPPASAGRAPSRLPAPPAWFTEARSKAGVASTRNDSDDDSEGRSSNPFG